MAARFIPLLLKNRVALIAATTILGSGFGSKKIFDSLAKQGSENTHAHPDKSKAHISVRPQIEKKVTILIDEQEGKRKHIILGQREYSTMILKQIETLENLRQNLRTHSDEAVKAQLQPVFSSISDRSDRFADWYFAYSTTFKLLREASTSAARHALRSGSISEAISKDIESFLERKYERIVLQPEISDPQLRQAYSGAVRSVHTSFVSGMSRVQQELLDELHRTTSHVDPLPDSDVELSLDWASQLYKIKALPAQYEKLPELTIALSAGGALVGKATGAVGGKAAANAFLSKIAAPFATKVLGPSTGAMMGSVAGPVGAMTGAVIGIGIDYGLNKGIEIMQRDKFVADLQHVIGTTQRDYEHRMQGELLRVIDVWIDDSIQLLLLKKKE